jgi:Zn finger protein HypA/HybF involved in hydrogenase expression
MSGFKCLECGRKFKTVKAAERAANSGCPKCGGVDVDLDCTGREYVDVCPATMCALPAGHSGPHAS